MTEGLTTTQSVIGALAIALVLAALHLLTPRIRRLPGVPEEATGSFAGGLAVAYVFLHLLPEIAAGNEAIGEVLGDVLTRTPLMALGIFLVALAGFTVFYGLERLADRASRVTAGPATEHRDTSAAAAAVHSDRRGAQEPPSGIYRLQLGSFLVYNALITYTMVLRLRTGLAFAVLFTVAMGLHFVLTDRGLEERYPRQFSTGGRLALAGALVVGWLLSAVFAPSSAVVVALVTALLGGSILLNVFKEEVPAGRRSSFGWFVVGLVLYAGLIVLLTVVSE